MEAPPPSPDLVDEPDDGVVEPGLLETNLHSLPLLARGKVRDNYAVGDDRLLMVASDRISAFDVVMNEPIPGKGKLLTEMALFWFDRLSHIVPNHLTGEDPESVVAEDEREQVRGRSMLVKRLKPIPIEAVVRGYLAGSGWKEYQATGTVCGVPLPPGLQMASKLPAPIFTPATKAEAGHHDENIDFERASALIGAERAQEVRDVAIRLYNEASAYALTRGIVIADTKFEFGLDENDRLVLMDEVLTPDSSRYWEFDKIVSGQIPPSYDKQVLRDWLETACIDGKPWPKSPPPPPIDPKILRQTQFVYARVRSGLIAVDDEIRRTSVQIRELELAINEAADPIVADALCVDHIIALARSGRQHEAEARAVDLRRRREAAPHTVLTVRMNIAEGVVDYFGGRAEASVNKMTRAYKLAFACHEIDLLALSASWLAHFAWNSEDVESACRFAREALANSAPTNHAALARVSLVLAEILALSARDDLAQPWIRKAQRHSAAIWDAGFRSALAFNLATIRLMQLRQCVLSGIDDPSLASVAQDMRTALTNADSFFGVHDDLRRLQDAQLLSLVGKAQEALRIYLHIADTYKGTSNVRERGVWLADEAWCFSRLGRHDEALKVAGRAIAAIHSTTQIDDLASIHSMLAEIYRRANRTSDSEHFAALARREWSQYVAFQARCVALCRGITDSG